MSKKKKWLYQRRRMWAIRQLIAKYGNICFLCEEPIEKKQDITIDHWIPRVEGGSDDITNLRLAHDECNADKGRMLPEEWEALQSGENL